MVKGNRVPLEYRPMKCAKGGALVKGSVEMWIDLICAGNANEMPLSVLRPPPPVEVEIRVVLWSCRDLSLRLCFDENTHEARERIDIIAKCAIDCRAYNGRQSKDGQETDVHHSSDGEGEFNWRFVFSNISVTKGVPLDCFLQLSILEYFSFSRPAMLCETMVDLKNYCKRVALTGEHISIESELPMENQQLKRILTAEANGGSADDLGDGDDEGDDASESEASEAGGDENMLDRGEEIPIPPAGMIKVLVEVWSQVEASDRDVKVGLGREEPNRSPCLTYPATGRSWQAVLPTAAAVVEGIIEAYQGGTKRAKWLMLFATLMMVIVALHKIPGTTGCPVIQDSCKETCSCCTGCADTTKEDAVFCYYKFLSGYPDACLSSINAYCRCADSSCSANECVAGATQIVR
jgi:hypothetical protein